jgi:transposase
VVPSDDLRALLQTIGGWTGFTVGQWTIEDTLAPDPLGFPAPRLIIELRRDEDTVPRCSRCGAPVPELHEITPRRVRDLALMAHDVWLLVPQARLQCPRCGPTVERIPWLDRYQRMTTRLAEQIARLANERSVRQDAAHYHVSWATVKQLHARALIARLGPMDAADFSQVRRIAVDEFALHRGQTYATVVVEVDTKRVLWVARGREEATLRGFFIALGPAGCARLEAVVLDLATPYLKAIRTHCPHVAIVYDLFHALLRYTAQVLDRVRMDEANRLGRPNRHDRRTATQLARRHLTGKGVRWLLLREGTRLGARADRMRLRDLLAANHALFVVYVLKEDLRALWRYRHPGWARRAWASWYARAQESGIAAMQRFAQRLALIAEYIINHARYPLHTSLLEGINNKIKVMKRVAYGYRDDAYFFLRIRAAFPGIP